MKPVKQSLLFDCLATLLGGAIGKPAAKARKVSLPPPLPAPGDQKLRILLAEDNIVNQEVAQGILRKLGYRADAVANGHEVLEALRRIRYDVILMDCQMPELDGYETTRRIRQFEQKRIRTFDWETPIRIIAMTAHAMHGDREKCLTAGMNDYLSKPVRQNELKAALEQPIVTETVSSGDVAVESENDFMHLGTDSAVPDGSAPAALLVDTDRLRDVTDNEPARMRRLVDIYLTEAAPMLDELGAAIESNSSEDIMRLAHKLIGSSISCGVQAFTNPLRELEELSRGGDLSRASALFEEIRHKFPGVRSAFHKFLGTIPGPAVLTV